MSAQLKARSHAVSPDSWFLLGRLSNTYTDHEEEFVIGPLLRHIRGWLTISKDVSVHYAGDLDSVSDFDPNFDADQTELGTALNSGRFDDSPSDTCCAGNDSPYPEVRAAVANFDDPTMPSSTIRAWTLGLLWALVLPSVNQFFLVR